MSFNTGFFLQLKTREIYSAQSERQQHNQQQMEAQNKCFIFSFARLEFFIYPNSNKSVEINKKHKILISFVSLQFKFPSISNSLNNALDKS